MRCADFGPTPGRHRSDWISSSRAAGFSIESLEGQSHSRRQVQSRREPRHLRLRRGFSLRYRIVHRGHHQVLEHVLVLADEARIDAHLLHIELAGNHDLHKTCARPALDFDLSELFLGLLHVLLHLLRLLHQRAQSALHHGVTSLSLDCFPESSAGRMDEGTTSAPRSRTSSRTNGSSSIASAALACFSAISRDFAAATLAPAVAPTRTLKRNPGPNCAARSAFNLSW